MKRLYRLKALSVNMGGHLFKKEDGKVFDPEGKDKSIKIQIYDAVGADFLEKVTEKQLKVEAEAAEKEKEKNEQVELVKKKKKEAAEKAEREAKKEAVEAAAKARSKKESVSDKKENKESDLLEIDKGDKK
jgi:hypothetical protein